MNSGDDKDSKMTIHPEISAAEHQVHEDQRALSDSLDRFHGTVDRKAQDVNHRVEDTVERAQDKLEENLHKMENVIQQGEQLLNEQFGKADAFIGELGQDLEMRMGRVRDIYGRVRAGTDQAIDQADQAAGRVEGMISTVRQDFIQSADDLLVRAERIAGSFRENLQRGTGQIRGFMDRAEEIVTRMSDPAQFIAKNPRLGIATLFVGGLVIGLFFRNLFTGERMVGEVPMEGAAMPRIQPRSEAKPTDEASDLPHAA